MILNFFNLNFMRRSTLRHVDRQLADQEQVGFRIICSTSLVLCAIGGLCFDGLLEYLWTTGAIATLLLGYAQMRLWLGRRKHVLYSREIKRQIYEIFVLGGKEINLRIGGYPRSIFASYTIDVSYELFLIADKLEAEREQELIITNLVHGFYRNGAFRTAIEDLRSKKIEQELTSGMTLELKEVFIYPSDRYPGSLYPFRERIREKVCSLRKPWIFLFAVNGSEQSYVFLAEYELGLLDVLWKS